MRLAVDPFRSKLNVRGWILTQDVGFIWKIAIGWVARSRAMAAQMNAALVTYGGVRDREGISELTCLSHDGMGDSQAVHISPQGLPAIPTHSG